MTKIKPFRKIIAFKAFKSFQKKPKIDFFKTFLFVALLIQYIRNLVTF